MKKSKLIVGIVVAAAIIIVPAVWRNRSEPVEEILPIVDVVRMETASIELQRELVGSVEPADVVYIYPKMGGEVTAVYVKPGDTVEAGQTLCVIDTKLVESADLNLRAAQTALQDARKNLERMSVLYAAGDISSQAMEQVESAATNAQIQYDSAKLNYDNQMEYSYITATIGGIVESFSPQVHENVSSAQQICVISGEGGKVVDFSVPEKIARQLTVGDSVTVEKSGMTYQGVVTEVSTMLSKSTGLVPIKASVSGGELLSTGSTVKLYVTSDRAENVMTLPVDTVYYSGGDAYVYTYEEGTVHQVPVDTGIFDDERIQILSGIDAESQVITTWSSELYEGSAVRVDADTAEAE